MKQNLHYPHPYIQKENLPWEAVKTGNIFAVYGNIQDFAKEYFKDIWKRIAQQLVDFDNILNILYFKKYIN